MGILHISVIILVIYQLQITIIKNNHGRKIYLRVNRSGETITVCDCFYIDRPLRNGKKAIPLKFKTSSCTTDDSLNLVTPAGLNTIYFDYSFENLLQIVNNELNCDFTNVIITSDTFGFEKIDVPVCGSI